MDNTGDDVDETSTSAEDNSQSSTDSTMLESVKVVRKSDVTMLKSSKLCGGYNCDSTSIRRLSDGRSTAYRKSFTSQWRNITVAADPLAAVTLTVCT